MEIKKIVEGMTAPQVVEVIDSNFKGLNEEKELVKETLSKTRNELNLLQYQNGIIASSFKGIEFKSLKDKSVDITIKGSLIFHKSNGGGFTVDVSGTYNVGNAYSLFIDVVDKQLVVDSTRNEQTNKVLLAFNSEGRIVSGALASTFIQKENEKNNIVEYYGMIGDETDVMLCTAYSPSTGEIIDYENLDATDFIRIAANTSYIFVNKPFFNIECYDKEKNHLGRFKNELKSTSLLDSTKYITISFLKSENIDYDSLRVIVNEDDYNNAITGIIGVTPQIMKGKAYGGVDGVLSSFDLLDCTNLIKVPLDGNVSVFSSSPIYTIACFDSDYNYIGYSTDCLLRDGTKYFSISYFKSESVDYEKLKIRIIGENSELIIPTPRKGKKYYLFGDSITYWDSRTSWYDDNVYMVAYPSYIRDCLGAVITNKGVPGDISYSITDRLLNTDLSDAYAVTYMAGTNDANNDKPIGEIGTLDTNTYIGNLEIAVRHVLTNYPKVKFYFISPLYMKMKNITPYCEAMQKVANEYGVPIIRWDLVGGINKINTDYYTVEGVHPTNEGHKLFADSLIPFLQNH